VESSLEESRLVESRLAESRLAESKITNQRNIYLSVISTCCKDIQFVNILKKKLESFNYNVYFPEEKEKEIVINKHLIEKSFCMIVILFDSKIRNNLLFIEMGYAIAKNISIVIITEKDMFKIQSCGCGEEVQRDFQLLNKISKLLFYCPLELRFIDKYVPLLNEKLLTLQ
jgi:hypothetical protein